MDLTKQSLKAALGVTTDAELGRLFEPPITRSAVNQWADDKPIPKGRQWELQVRRPDLFVRVLATKQG